MEFENPAFRFTEDSSPVVYQWQYSMTKSFYQ